MRDLDFVLNVLEENNKSDLSLREYVEYEADNDPNFFSWLFDEHFDEDYDGSLTQIQRDEYNAFLNTL